jgi:hypothetical protein
VMPTTAAAESVALTPSWSLVNLMLMGAPLVFSGL